jgi:N-acetylglucosamine-6-sulfatase
MNRWKLPVLAILALLAGPVPSGRTDSPVPEPLNVLVIMTDDQTEADMLALPKTRALLGGRGTTFANSFASYPLCCPSRATLLTGQYPHNHGVRANAPPLGGYPRLDHSNTLAVWLQAAGYYTAHVGKYLNGYGTNSPAPPPGWSRWFGLMDPSTYRLYGYKVSVDGVPVQFGDSAADYQTDVLAAEAERIIRSRAGAQQPFFLWVAPVAPHLEMLGRHQFPPRPAPRHVGAFARAPLPPKPSFNEADVQDKPAHIRKRPRLKPGQVQEMVRLHRARLESLLAVDDLVERLVRALEQTGQIDRTLVIFTSDNGFFLGEHRLPKGKFLPYEESSRVPLLVRGRDFPADHTVRHLVSNVDLAPTIVHWTGRVAPARLMDGRPLQIPAADLDEARDRTLLLEGARLNANSPEYAAARDDRWLYVEYATGAQELYDLRSDPYQIRSLHAAPALTAVREGLAARLARLRDCSGSECL